jgi:putative tricarboxylic transport membrane protein
VLIANFVLLAMNVPMVKVFVKILEVPPAALMPAGTMISMVDILADGQAIST